MREALQTLADALPHEHRAAFDAYPRSLIGDRHLPLYDAYKLARAVLRATEPSTFARHMRRITAEQARGKK